MSSSRSWRNEFTNLGKAYFAYTSSPSPQADQKGAVYEVILGFVFNAGKEGATPVTVGCSNARKLDNFEDEQGRRGSMSGVPPSKSQRVVVSRVLQAILVGQVAFMVVGCWGCGYIRLYFQQCAVLASVEGRVRRIRNRRRNRLFCRLRR
jgi:hypothetical protein